MKSYLFESRFYRDEVLRWALIGVLSVWAVSATAVLLMKRDKTIIIAVSDDSSYVVGQTNPNFEKKEVLSFIKSAVDQLYSFNEKTFDAQLTNASNLMADDLWELKRAEYLSLSEKIKKDPLTQKAEILSIDQKDERHVEILLNLMITHKLAQMPMRLRVELEVAKHNRTEENPWGYQIIGIKDATL